MIMLIPVCGNTSRQFFTILVTVFDVLITGTLLVGPVVTRVFVVVNL